MVPLQNTPQRSMMKSTPNKKKQVQPRAQSKKASVSYTYDITHKYH